MDISFFTTLKAGWINAWIPTFGTMLVQFVYMLFCKDGVKRALDTSWYSTKEKICYFATTLLQIALLAVSIFVPIKSGTAWDIIGAILYIISSAFFIWALYSYAAAPADKLIDNGIYRWSRNPMYVCYYASMLAVCIASASLWLLLILIVLTAFTHFSILGEERYCEKTYGEEYLRYKQKTPRYLIW